MKTNLASALRASALAVALFLVPAIAAAKDADAAAQQLAVVGSVPVKNAGPYVEAGTFRIQVEAKLGHPGAVLADGTWLYPNREVAGSDARGTLVVRFDAKARVSELSLVTPVVATAMLTSQKTSGKVLVAGR